MAEHDQAEALKGLEARVEALSAALRSVLATLVLRGVLNRADMAALLREAEAGLGAGHPAGAAELQAIRDDMPAVLRAAAGPPPDPDEDDH